jgi:hypothetical protein
MNPVLTATTCAAPAPPGAAARPAPRPEVAGSSPASPASTARAALSLDSQVRTPRAKLTQVEGLCAWCLEHGVKGCPACTQRRRKVVRLHDRHGVPLAKIAEQMGLAVERVERLLEQERDRRDTERFRLSELPNEQIRALFLRRKQQDPNFSAARLAGLAGLSCCSHVERELGLIATSDKTVNGVRYPGRIKTTIRVDNAEKVLRAMGLQPRDIEHILDGEELQAR